MNNPFDLAIQKKELEDIDLKSQKKPLDINNIDDKSEDVGFSVDECIQEDSSDEDEATEMDSLRKSTKSDDGVDVLEAEKIGKS